MTLTVVNAGTQHNVVPDCCKMLVDVRTNEHYTNEEVYDIIKANVKSESTPTPSVCIPRIYPPTIHS